MKCPNEYCGGKVEENVKDTGDASRYCLDGCGYYEEFKTTPPRKRVRERVPPMPPRRPRKLHQ